MYIYIHVLNMCVSVDYSNAEYGEGSGPFWLDGLSCQESDESIFSCSRNLKRLYYNGCNKDVVVLCEREFD